MKRKRQQFAKVPRKAYNYFRDITPIDKGNARRKTKFETSATTSTINADYAYAVPLNTGHSKQAKEGMTKPTIRYIKKLINRIVRGK